MIYAIQWDTNANSGVGALQWFTTYTHTLLKSNNTFYTLDTNLEATPITADTPTKEEFIEYGFPSLEGIMTKLTTQQKPLTDIGNIKTVAVPDGWSGITIE